MFAFVLCVVLKNLTEQRAWYRAVRITGDCNRLKAYFAIIANLINERSNSSLCDVKPDWFLRQARLVNVQLWFEMSDYGVVKE